MELHITHKPTIFIMIGLQGSGKSTYAHFIQQLFLRAFGVYIPILSCDKLRATQGYKSERAVWNEFYKQLDDFILDDSNIIIDNTNIKREWRADIFKILHSHPLADYQVIAIVVNTPLQTCIERQELRERKVPESAIRRYKQMYEPANEDEGFDKIIYSIDGVFYNRS